MSVILEKIKYQLEKTLEKREPPFFGAFDADGTLWSSDVGKSFFLYQVEKGLLKGKTFHPQEDFDRVRVTKGKKQALCWLAQVQAGISLEQMRMWVSDFLREKPVKVFPFQKCLIDWLIRKNVQVFVVSSSLKWVLTEALKSYGLLEENIIGVETLVEKGVITDKLVLPPPIHKDKVEAFKRKTSGACPIFCAGNTLSDQALLEYTSSVKLVISTAKEGERNYESERSLLEIARKKKWFYQDGMPSSTNLP